MIEAITVPGMLSILGLGLRPDFVFSSRCSCHLLFHYHVTDYYLPSFWIAARALT
jgi:hypothetical protein